MLRRGSRLGKYRLEQKLGSGAFANVWRARDTVENRRVALKVALPSVVDEYGPAELEREARLWVRLAHPNIVAIRNADWIDGYFVAASELADRNLAEFPGARADPVPWRSGIIRDIAAGLAHAHGLRVMHRDVKPENVMIFADRRAALGDFGVSRFSRGITRSFTKVGTLGYMAPEQAYGQPTFSSDVFSLGLIAYELLTSVRPRFPFEWPFEHHRRFAQKTPEPVQRVLRRATAFDPKRRYRNAIELHRALEAAFGRVEAEKEKRRAPRRPSAPARPHAVAAGCSGRGVSQAARFAPGDALQLFPLRGPAVGVDALLSLVRHRGELVPGDQQLPARVSRLRARRASRVDRLSVVSKRAAAGERQTTAARPEGDASLQSPRLPRPAQALDALLPGVQAEDAAPVERRRTRRPLCALSLVGFQGLLELLPLVRPQGRPQCAPVPTPLKRVERQRGSVFSTDRCSR